MRFLWIALCQVVLMINALSFMKTKWFLHLTETVGMVDLTCTTAILKTVNGVSQLILERILILNLMNIDQF